MKNIVMYITLAAVCALHLPSAHGEDIRKFRRIEFKGLKYLSGKEIIRKARTREVTGGIVVDVDSLKSALSATALVNTYTIREKGGVLGVAVAEKKPVALIMVRKGEYRIPVETGGAAEIISINSVHANDVPVVHAGPGEFRGGRMSTELKGLIGLLSDARKSFPVLYGQIGEMRFAQDGVEVMLTGRRTVFTMKAVMGDVTYLNYIVGYLDIGGYYPERMPVSDRIIYR